MSATVSSMNRVPAAALDRPLHRGVWSRWASLPRTLEEVVGMETGLRSFCRWLPYVTTRLCSALGDGACPSVLLPPHRAAPMGSPFISFAGPHTDARPCWRLSVVVQEALFASASHVCPGLPVVGIERNPLRVQDPLQQGKISSASRHRRLRRRSTKNNLTSTSQSLRADGVEYTSGSGNEHTPFLKNTLTTQAQ